MTNESKMTGYLVVARYNLDDLPIGLFENFWEADEFIENSPGPNTAILDQFIDAGGPLSEFRGYSVVAFENGRPIPEGSVTAS